MASNVDFPPPSIILKQTHATLIRLEKKLDRFKKKYDSLKAKYEACKKSC